MKRVLVFIVGLFVVAGAFAAGENVPTSQSFVDSAIAQKQDKIPANTGAAQVLTNTGNAGTIGTKNIYDSSASYTEQTDGLITAGQFNTAVQNAIDSEFECIDWDANDGCLLVRLTGANTLPTGYTALQYLESTGTQYLNLGQPIGSGENITVKFEYTQNKAGIWFGARSGTYSMGFAFDFAVAANSLFIICHSTDHYGYQFDGLALMIPYILNWRGTPFMRPTLAPKIIGSYKNLNESNYMVTPLYNAYLFKYNHGGTAVGNRPMRIHFFRVEGKFDLIPVRRDSDGELGMYDTITNTFFTNSGTGEFIAGPVANLYLPSGN